MSDTSVTGAGRRHFTPEDEDMLRRNESTNDIVKRDTKSGEDIHGRDLSRRELEVEQKSSWGGAKGAAHIGLAVFDAAHVGEVEIFAGMTAAGALITGSLAGFALGVAGLMEARKEGAEQSASTTQEAMHAGLIGALDLPTSYKNLRIEGDYANMPMQKSGQAAWDMAGAIRDDKKGLAVLQARADAGMVAARDMVATSGVENKKGFLAAHPNIAALYAKDAAFHEGFDAYAYTADIKSERAALDARLDGQDVRATQTQFNVRG